MGGESRAVGWGVLVDEVKVMRSNRLRTWGLIAVVVSAAGPNVRSAEPTGPVVNRTSIRLLSEAAPMPVVASVPLSVSVLTIDRKKIQMPTTKSATRATANEVIPTTTPSI